jgi:hypothetical protein
MVPVARFLCRATGRTFSLLPYELAPYHVYTIESMVKMLLLVVQVREEDGTGVGAALQEAPHECDVMPWLIACWARTAVKGFRRGHHELAKHFDLDGVSSRPNPLDEVAHYCHAFRPRGPPGKDLYLVILLYSEATGRHLMGVASQERCAR